MFSSAASPWKLIPAVALTAGAVAFGGSPLYAEVAATQPAEQQQPADMAAPAPAFLGVAVAEAPAGVIDARRSAPVLVVSDVHPGSPADEAGLKPGDLLLQLDDQLLLHPVQLARLVQEREPGSDATLTVERDGEALSLTATLTPRPDELARFHERPGQALAFPEGFRMIPAEPFGNAQRPDIDRMFRDMEQQMRDMREQLQNGPRLHLDLDKIAPGDLPQASKSVITHSDGNLTATVTTTPDGRHLEAVDAEGKVLFDGPIDTEEQLQAVPDAVRKLLPDTLPAAPRVVPLHAA